VSSALVGVCFDQAPLRDSKQIPTSAPEPTWQPNLLRLPERLDRRMGNDRTRRKHARHADEQRTADDADDPDERIGRVFQVEDLARQEVAR